MKRCSRIWLLLLTCLAACAPPQSRLTPTAATLVEPTSLLPGMATAPLMPTPPSSNSNANVVLYRGNAQRTGVYEAPALRQLPQKQWQTKAGRLWLMPPLVTDDIVYAGGGDGKLYAFDVQTGKQLWSAGGFDQMESTGAIIDDLIIAGGYSQKVQAFDRHSGNPRWSFHPRSVVQAPPLIAGEIVYIATDRATYALDARTGQLKWEAATGHEGAFMAGPAYAQDVLYTTGGKLLLALESTTGKERWRVERDTPFTALAIDDQMVYVGNFDRVFRAFDRETGAERWTFTATGEFWSAPAIDHGTVYVGNTDGTLYALQAQTGEKIWSFETASPDVSDPIIANGVVYVSDSAHELARGPRHLYALDAATGQELWTFETVSTFLPTPAVRDNAIYVTATGEIFRLQAP